MGNRIIRLFTVLLFLSAVFALNNQAFAKDLIIASFETADRSDLGTEMGTWSSNTLDSSQGTTMRIIPMYYGVPGKKADDNHVVKITYDVATNGPALNGFYIMLNKLDMRPYKKLSMMVKGDADYGFTTKFKITLTNSGGQRSSYVLRGITGDWQLISIPMQGFTASGTLRDMSSMVEMDVAFDDMTVDNKNGIFYIDEIKLSTD
ncbi:MAG: carbohydrate binding domain-containing protein [Candidatus Omnitrophica bacterium]|nr:carbohydrate binding domain-containing protein [Candidatus Omnitrophota bacterium]MDD5310207.1 carbohydrate binding domain-containing protein [Candidatus Omnitrophota bacterium]MDD5546216.1 carbohydrate binding domain-containing protein [Candidatus Omnitrophota bacterium]